MTTSNASSPRDTSWARTRHAHMTRSHPQTLWITPLSTRECVIETPPNASRPRDTHP